VVAPKAVGGGVPRYSGEDFPEKASMLAYCDALVTYIHHVLEAAIKDRPLISCCIDAETGWPDNFWIPLHEIPTLTNSYQGRKCKSCCQCFHAGRVDKSTRCLLEHPELDRENRLNFVKQELTYIKR